MSMVPSTVGSAVALCIASFALASCSSDSSPNPSAPQDRAAAAGPGGQTREDTHDPPTSLLVLNETSRVVVLTSANSQNTASIKPGKSLQLASTRVCNWIPLTATTANGRLLEKYNKPCRGQTWTITDPSAERSNARALATGIRRLRAVGVQDVSEAEPPHGSRNAILTGLWHGTAFIISITPQDSTPTRHGTSRRFCGQVAQVLLSTESDPAGLAFQLDGHDWFVFSTSSATTSWRPAADVARRLLCD